MAAQKINPEQARRELASGQALLVCAYDDEEKCQQYRLTNALSLSELQAQETALPKDRTLLFYCA